MDFQIRKNDWLFMLVCLGLGILAELSFFHGKIGLSYLVFVASFYVVLFMRIRILVNHRRIGLLIMVAVWLLTGSYLFYDNVLFYNLNLFFIPVLIFFHIVLITSPNKLRWDNFQFIALLRAKLSQAAAYITTFCKAGLEKLFSNMNKQAADNVKRIGIGLAIGVPLLVVIIGLLMSADAVFQEVVLQFPQFLLELNFLEGFFRVLAVILLTLLFFGVLQVLHIRLRPADFDFNKTRKRTNKHWNSVTSLTILVMLNSVYVLFAVIQFRYFFSEGLQDGFTYAEYARRGFFELVFVTLINWTILTSCLNLVKGVEKNILMKMMYSLLIVASGVMLASAYQRLSMYEAAYGFTIARLLAHAFMIFLMVIFAYTLIRVWIERLSLLHFYLIAGLIFYTILNVINIEQIIVDKNLERYKQIEKIDIYYLSTLSYTGTDGLIKLYERREDYPELKDMLRAKQERLKQQDQTSWQSFNFTKQKVIEKLQNLEL
ncbi:DUF4173 domain-containing protein [Virgibacillus sp. C22-A2]|uniref:DUF4173 domain-containing protein n=1 Tax=Virgibacillus tibetensis TaxID=3042313 RepID=A0ABU6KK92_9BACI|nr:DUF4173 domain-containing protein [Virgibacillus sp. C22-A2]